MQSTANKLTLRLAFFTAKSRRQTTPNLIKNPNLTTRGVLTKIPQSYRYNIPEGTPNSHLYWNPSIQNKLRRQDYNHHKLYKLGIRSIHDSEGNPLYNRSQEEVLWELTNLRLIKQSLGRTLVNLREVADRFPDVMNQQDRDIVVWALDQIDSRFLPSMKIYDFSTYCFLRERLGLDATAALVVHMYKWVDSEVEQPQGKYKPKYMLANLRYVFRSPSARSGQLQDILLPKQIEFKLFEDAQPANKPIKEILPRLFTEKQLQELKQDSAFKISSLSFLSNIPGGEKLLDRIKDA